MEQKDIRKAPLVLLNIALVLQVIYLVGSFLLVIYPEFFLKMVTVGYEGGYAMPFDSIHFSMALITTIIFSFMYILLTINIKRNNELGIGFGLILGAMSYVAYFLSKSLTAELINRWIEAIKNDAALVATWTLGVDANLACYTLILAFHELIKLALSTAIVLVLVAYGIYCYKKREQNTPKRLYK